MMEEKKEYKAGKSQDENKGVVTPVLGERLSGESAKAVIACNDYLRMGPGRSFDKLLLKYHESTTETVPTIHRKTLANWSVKYGWVKRAELYDQEMERIKTEYAQQVMNSGLALDHERVEKLKELFNLLIGQLMKEVDGKMPALWLPDVKQIGSGEFAERVDIERYNSPLINDIRGLLDDLAKETGGRVKNVDHTTKGDKIQTIGFDMGEI
jgi:hypothetical protein